MLLINLMVNLLYRKYGVPLHNFFENWTRGISYLNANVGLKYCVTLNVQSQVTIKGLYATLCIVYVLTIVTENKLEHKC